MLEFARSILVCVGLLAALPAQTEDQQIAYDFFRERFVAAVRSIHEPRPDYDRCLQDLEAVAEFIPELEPRLRAYSRLGVEVRRAEVLLLRGDDAECAQRLIAARRTAIDAGAWGRRVRELADALLWQADPFEFDAIYDDERAFLRERETEIVERLAAAEAPRQRRELVRRLQPLAVMRLNRDLHDPATALAAERELAEFAESWPDNDPWRHKAFGVLAWHFLLQRDLMRAGAYVDKLPADLARYPRALIALRNGDHPSARGEAEELARADARYGALLGEVLERAGQFKAALDAYKDTLAAKLSPVDRLIVLRSLGECLLAQDEPDTTAARRYLDEAVELGESVAKSAGEFVSRRIEVEMAQVVVARGRAFESVGEVEAALASYGEAIRRLDEVRQRSAYDVFGGTVLALDDLDAVEGVLRTAPPAAADRFETMAAVETGKARTLLDWIRDPPEVEDAFAAGRLALAVHELAANPRRADPGRATAELEQRRLEAGDGGGARRSRAFDADVLREHVRASSSSVFLSYWLGAEACWVVWAHGEESGVVRLADRATAERALDGAAFVMRGAGRDPDAALAAAARCFLPNEVTRRLGMASRVVFCPDEELGRLPFEALPLAGQTFDGRPLGVAIAVERCPSLSVRVELAARVRSGTGVAVLHSVAAGASVERALGLEALVHSDREAELVERAYGRARRLSGADATAAGLRSLIGEEAYDVVHVSAHAVANARVPTSSLLVLADGAASVVSFMGTNLDGALLVLSACSSATGDRDRGGEGEVGLIGWPLAAGARGAVAALWPVNQQATKDLMGQFHAIRAEGRDSVEAMRAAREVLWSAPNYRHPHYWAGFGVYVPEATAAGAVGGWGWDWGWSGWWLAAGVLALVAFVACKRVFARR